MRVTRFLIASLGAAVLSIGLSGVAGAQTGQTGAYIFVDSQLTPGVICKYSTSSPYKLYKLTIKAPQVWWPDTSSNSNTQHGPVGWQAFVYHKGQTATTWKLLKKSTIQRATAYEGYPGTYDLADKAPFTNISMSVPGSSYMPTHEWRVKVKAYWFNKVDGSVMGSVSHTVFYYKFGTGSTDVTTDHCTTAV